jgi:ABC-2 type transport system permease protein
VGVRLSLARWATMTALILLGLVPFAAMGIALGHTLTIESMGPAMGGITSLLALLGGAWGPIGETGLVHDTVQFLPSYWLVQAAKSAVNGGGWPLRGWLVMAAWTVGLTVLAMRAFRRDTERV